MTNVKSLLALYLKMGGSLTDTYSDIAGGIPVGQYSLISDAVLACSKKYSSGGGSEKFIVTIIDNAGVTSNKTVAEILAAKAAGKEVVAHVTSSAYSNQVVELPLVWSIASEAGSAVFFSGCAPRLGQTVTEMAYSVYCVAQTGQEEEWLSYGVELGEGVPSYTSSNNGQVLGVSSGLLAWVDNYAPLIVTLTESVGAITGDKTYQEVKKARFSGRPVDLVLSNASCASVIDVSDNGSTISVTFIANGQLATATGAPSDYVGITLG